MIEIGKRKLTKGKTVKSNNSVLEKGKLEKLH